MPWDMKTAAMQYNGRGHFNSGRKRVPLKGSEAWDETKMMKIFYEELKKSLKYLKAWVG